MSRRDDPPIELYRIPGKGRAVIAIRRIRKGEVVEVCPVILMRMQDVRGSLRHYHFHWAPRVAAVALGLGSIYNHSCFPNLWTTKHGKRQELIFRALRDVADGEELTHDYGYLPRGYISE